MPIKAVFGRSGAQNSAGTRGRWYGTISVAEPKKYDLSKNRVCCSLREKQNNVEDVL